MNRRGIFRLLGLAPAAAVAAVVPAPGLAVTVFESPMFDLMGFTPAQWKLKETSKHFDVQGGLFGSLEARIDKHARAVMEAHRKVDDAFKDVRHFQGGGRLFNLPYWGA